MALAYREPGVSVQETVTPQISPLLAVPALICLVGPAQGFQTRTDQFLISGTSPTPLPGLPDGATLSAVLNVRDALNPSAGAADGSGYTLTTDYTVSTTNGTITRVGGGTIPSSTLVNVTYEYIPANYYAPTRLDDLASVETRYGSALSADGTSINSPLSYAAGIAFENGAGSIVCQALFTRATPGDPTSAAQAPTSTSAAASTSWADTLHVLRDIEDINVLVPVIGQSDANVGDASLLQVFQVFQDHAYFMRGEDQYTVNIFGEDQSESATVATSATVRAHADTLRSRYNGSLAEQTVVLAATKLTRSLPSFGRTITLGGQFAAAAIAGMLSNRAVSDALTRDVVSGFSGVNAGDKATRNADSAAGLMVLESKGQNIIVRQGVTIDTSQPARAELSVVRAKHRMIESVRDTLDRQIIGKIIADGNAEGTVRTTVVSVLEQLRQGRDLVDYSGVQAKLVSLEPTRMQVRFSYRPAFPLNYIDIIFSLDLTAGTVGIVDPNASDTAL